MSYQFSAAVGRVLQLMIHSVYTNKEIFLRELISNASDACDKLRYLAIENPQLLSSDPLEIKIFINKEKNTITIIDNGIGMDQEELKENLGTIASSGTKKFFEAIEKDQKDLNLIGQFGVGFYSSFLVSDKVKVWSRKAGQDKIFLWESNGLEGFDLSETSENFPPGTKIELALKPSELEFLEKHRLAHIIKTYSDHLTYPVDLIDSEGKSEIINKGKALWLMPKNEVSQKEYYEFYKYIAHTPEEPYLVLPIQVEGKLSYKSLIFIPNHKPYDLFHPDRMTRVKLYIKRVFITEESNYLIPSYLRFIRGVVDSDDLPLNISREILQNNDLVNKIRGSLVKKILLELKKKAEKEPEDFLKFWINFGEVMKEGLCEPGLGEKEELFEVCRFYSTKSDDKLISLNDYLERMLEGQEEIFFITGDNLENLKANPQLEGFIKRDLEVLLLKDGVDDFWVNVINSYKNKALKSVNRVDIDLNKIKSLEEDKQEINNSTQDKKDNYQALQDGIKNILGDKIKEVIISKKLIDSPACLVLPEGAMNIRMERLLIEQKQISRRTAKLLEINPKSPLIIFIEKELNTGKIDQDLKDLVELLYYQACITEGEIVENPCDLVAKLNRILVKYVSKI
jgi:molecular chaperone HtpG